MISSGSLLLVSMAKAGAMLSWPVRSAGPFLAGLVLACACSVKGARLPESNLEHGYGEDNAAASSTIAAVLGCIVLATMMASVCTFCRKKPEEPEPVVEESGA